MTPEELTVWAENARVWIQILVVTLGCTLYAYLWTFKKWTLGCPQCDHCTQRRMEEERKQREAQEEFARKMGFDGAAWNSRPLRKGKEAPPPEQEPRGGAERDAGREDEG